MIIVEYVAAGCDASSQPRIDREREDRLPMARRARLPLVATWGRGSCL